MQAAERLREAFAFMRTYCGKQSERMKNYYDASIKPKSFVEGSFVLLHSPTARYLHYCRRIRMSTSTDAASENSRKSAGRKFRLRKSAPLIFPAAESTGAPAAAAIPAR